MTSLSYLPMPIEIGGAIFGIIAGGCAALLLTRTRAHLGAAISLYCGYFLSMLFAYWMVVNLARANGWLP